MIVCVTYGRKDQEYVVDLCDEILGEHALREHRFDWLLGDANRRGARARLPVDAFYPRHRLVLEYWEAQHDEPSPFFDKRDKLTVSGVHRGEQRARYDRRRKGEVPRHGLALVIVRARDLVCDRHGRLLRRAAHDRVALTHLLRQAPAPIATDELERLPAEYTHVSVTKNYANPVVRRVTLGAEEQGQVAGARPAALGCSQRVTAPDIAAGRIRFPAAAIRWFPSIAGRLEVDLRGRQITAKWNPRNGPGRPRSGVLSVGRAHLDPVVRPDEVLTVRAYSGRIFLA
jgi:hypothetical protein